MPPRTSTADENAFETKRKVTRSKGLIQEMSDVTELKIHVTLTVITREISLCVLFSMFY